MSALLICALACASALVLQPAALPRPETTAARAPAAECLAKKKRGGGKGGGKGSAKQSGFAWASSFELKPFESTELRSLAELLCTVHETRTGKPIHASVRGASDVPRALWNAPIACLIVAPPPPPPVATAPDEAEASDEGAEPAPEYVYVYANVAALEVHGLLPTEYNTLIGKPAALSGKWGGDKKFDGTYSKKLNPPGVLLDEVSRWPLERMAVVDGKLAVATLGVAYAFAWWESGEGLICEPGGVRRAKALTAEQVEAAVEAQGVEVRRLKESGLGNKDAEVVDAVAELLRLKALLLEAA